MSRLHMRDYLTLKVKEAENKKFLSECRDDDSPSGRSLRVMVEATHAGIVNGNMRFYRPDRMRDGVSSWVSPGGFNKPVLINHEKDGEIIGRVLGARYKDLSFKYSLDYPYVKDMIFYQTDGHKRANLFDSIDWIVDHLQKQSGYRGLGYVELDLNITQPEAIRKVQADEFLTVSVGFGTDQAICSVCHTDWAIDDRCEHRLGRTYEDNKRAYLISGSFEYEECSFVNFPADPFAGTLSKGLLEDQLSHQMFFLGLPAQDQARILTEVGCQDGICQVYEADIRRVGPKIPNYSKEGQMSETTTPTLPDLLKEVTSEELTQDRALEIQKEVDSIPVEGDVEEREQRRLASTLTAVIRKNNWDGADSSYQATTESVQAKIDTFEEMMADKTDEERATYLDQLEIEAKEVGIEFTRPEKVADGAEGDAEANEAKGEGVKEGTDADDGEGSETETVPEATQKLLGEDAVVPKGTVAALDKLDALYMRADEEGKDKISMVTSALVEAWRAGSFLEFFKSRLENDSDSIVIPKSEHNALVDGIEASKKLADKLTKERDGHQATSLNLAKSLRREKAFQLVLIPKLASDGKVEGLTEEDLKEVDKKSTRSLESLRDSVDDILQKLGLRQVVEASQKTASEAALEVEDTASVEEEETLSETDNEQEPTPDSYVPAHCRIRDTHSERSTVYDNLKERATKAKETKE